MSATGSNIATVFWGERESSKGFHKICTALITSSTFYSWHNCCPRDFTAIKFQSKMGVVYQHVGGFKHYWWAWHRYSTDVLVREDSRMALFSRPSSWLYHEGTCYEVGHTWHPSCLYSFADLFCIVFWEGFKIYLPLYLVSKRTTTLHPFSL